MTINTNKERAERAEVALAAYMAGDTPDECHYWDIVSDTLHAAHAQGIDLVMLLRCAVGNFTEEHEEEGGTSPLRHLRGPLMSDY